MSNLPAVLAPLLGDAETYKMFHNKYQLSYETYFEQPEPSVVILNAIVRSRIAPLVDQGWFCTKEVEKTIIELVRTHTHFKHLTEDKVFHELALIPLMFGELSAGLSHKCMREVLLRILEMNDGNYVRVLATYGRDIAEDDHKSRPFVRSNSQPKDWRESEQGHDSACVIPSFNSDNSSETTFDTMTSRWVHSEPEILSSLATSSPSSASAPSCSRPRHQSGSNQRKIGDNWLLQEDPQYSQHTFNNSSSEGVELEISHSEEGVKIELHEHHGKASAPEVDGAAASLPIPIPSKIHSGIHVDFQDAQETVSRINYMLEQTNDMLSRLQSEVDEAQIEDSEALNQECQRVQQRIQKLVLEGDTPLGVRNDDQVAQPQLGRRHARRLLQGDDTIQSDISEPLGLNVSIDEGTVQEAVHLSISTAENNDSFDSSSSHFLDSQEGNDYLANDAPELTSDSSSDDSNVSFDGPFYLFRPERRLEKYPRMTFERAIKALTPNMVAAMAKKVGLPPGLLRSLELEVARVQLMLTVFRHISLPCDRGCEGDDSASSTTSEDTDSDSTASSVDIFDDTEPTATDDSDDSNSDLFGDHEDDDGDETEDEFEPSVPERPRRLTSSESSESGEDEIELALEATALRKFGASATRSDVSTPSSVSPI